MDPIVVLGSRVLHGRPGALLEQRLLKAIAIAQPGQQFIVSGHGEAGAMSQFLRERGVHDIVEDNDATSTNENLENAHKLAPHASKLTVVTNDFHALRTRLWAWHLGIPVRVVAAPTPREHRPRNYLREVVATPHSATRILYRKLMHNIRPSE